MQLFDDCQAVLAATLHALIGGKTVDLPFDFEQGIDPFDGLQCHWRDRRSFVATFGVRADVGQHEELAAYWLREPQPNTSRIGVPGLCRTGSADRCRATGGAASRRGGSGRHVVRPAQCWMDGSTARKAARIWRGRSHVEELLAPLPQHAHVITVTDGHPATLGWLGSVHGHALTSFGVEHFCQTGTIADLYTHFGIDTYSIIEAAEAAVRHSQRRRVRPWSDA